MKTQLVETLIVKSDHQLGVGWRTVRVAGLQRPCLLLSRCESVAEGAPRERDLLLGKGACYGRGMGVSNAVVYPSEAEAQSVAILRLILKLHKCQRIALVDATVLQHTVSRDDGIEYVLVRI